MTTHFERIAGIEERMPTVGRKHKVRLAREYRKSFNRHLRSLAPGPHADAFKATHPIPKWAQAPDVKGAKKPS